MVVLHAGGDADALGLRVAHDRPQLFRVQRPPGEAGRRAATATASADDPPRPEPAGTCECVMTLIPVSMPSARRMWATSQRGAVLQHLADVAPSTFCSVSCDSMRTPDALVSTRHQARRSIAKFTVTAPGWNR